MFRMTSIIKQLILPKINRPSHKRFSRITGGISIKYARRPLNNLGLRKFGTSSMGGYDDKAIKPFVDLAKSNPINSNIGFLMDGHQFVGSCTYLPDYNIVFTANHCVEESKNISDLTVGIAGELIKIQDVHTSMHWPVLRNSCPIYDIAMLKLEKKPKKSLPPILIDFCPFTIKYNLTALGYGVDLTKRLPNDLRIKRDINNHQFPPILAAVHVPYCETVRRGTTGLPIIKEYEYERVLYNLIGFKPKVKMPYFESKTTIQMTKLGDKYQYLDAGTSSGFSGGPLLDHENKLVGINLGCIPKDDLEDNPKLYNKISGDCDYFLPFFKVKKWIEETLAEVKKDMEAVENQIKVPTYR